MLTESNGRPIRAAAYCRVSSDEQVEAQTIQAQVDFLQRWADLNDVALHDFYLDDGVSGKVPIRDRPEGKRLIEDAGAGKFGAVVVYRADRFARRLRVLLDGYEELDGLGVGLKSATESFDTGTAVGRLLMQLLGVFAEWELESIRERMSQGRGRAVREGRWTGGAAPYGYRVVDKRLAIDPEEAAAVRRIFGLYAEDGLGLVPLADLLNAEGVPCLYERREMAGGRWPNREHRWSPGALSNLLRNTVYAGRYTAGKRGGQHTGEYGVPAIVDQDAFDEAQRLLKDRFIEASRSARRLYLLRNLIKCHCGRVVIGEGAHTKGRYYYRCPNHHFSQRAEVLEELIWRHIAAYAGNPADTMADLYEELRREAADTLDVSAELEEIARQMAGKRAEQDGVISLYRRGRITEQQLDRQLDDLEAEVMALQSRQDALLTMQLDARSRQTALLTAQELLARLQGKVDEIERDSRSDDAGVAEAAMRAKRDLIKGLVRKITIDEDGTLRPVYVFGEEALRSAGGPESSGSYLRNHPRKKHSHESASQGSCLSIGVPCVRRSRKRRSLENGFVGTRHAC